MDGNLDLLQEVSLMSMKVRNNPGANSTLNKLNKNSRDISKSSKKLSSGMKINDAGDDASGYSISERMRAQIRALDQDTRNVQTGNNLVAVAEGAIQSIINNLRSMKEMCLNAMNDHNTDQDRATIQKEYDKRLELIQDIASETSYNGRILLDGRYKSPIAMRYNGMVELPTERNKQGELVPVYGMEEKTLSPIEVIWDLRSGAATTTTTTTSTTPTTPTTPSSTQAGLVQNTVLSNLASAFSARPGTNQNNNIRFTNNSTYGFSSSGNVEITVNFTGATKAGGAVDYSTDFHQQGFSIVCSGCNQFLNIRFDATTTTSTYNPNCSTTNWQATEYVIGIQGVTDEASLKAALFDGIKNAVGRSPESMSEKYRVKNPTYYNTIVRGGYAQDQPDSICVDPTHNFRLVRTDSGEYYFQKGESPLQVGIYDEGVFASDNTTSSTIPYLSPSGVPSESNALIIHHGPEANQHMKIYMNDMRLDAMKLTGTGTKTQKYAALSLGYVDYAIEYALNEATRMGAYRSRLEMTEANLVTGSENTQGAESVIRDADMAKEMTEYTKNNVLLQASQSMLAQANQNLSGVLSLLQ